VDDSDDFLCGRASTILANQTSAFAAVFWDCATGNFTFGHEIAHLQGARHDRTNDDSSSPFAYGHGYIDPEYDFRTIMGVRTSCNDCPRAQLFSTPFYGPGPLDIHGTEEHEDNARVLNETRYALSGFREPISVTISGPPSVRSYEWCTWTAVIGGGVPAASYQWSGITSGSSQVIIDNVSQSGNLSVIVYDGYGRGNNHTIHVTVDDLGPSCSG
jgi:hypothetical protein